MNDSPGWASPGSSPSDGERPDAAASAGSDGTPPTGRDGTGSGPAPGPKWSKEQPPPGQWSAPGPGGAAPGPVPGGPAPQPPQGGWGGNPHPGGAPQAGWGGGPAWGRPPAAKPGVIPLRPLAVGEILDGAVTTMREHWRTVLGITLAFAVVTQLAITLVQGFFFENAGMGPAEPGDPGELDEVFDQLGSSIGASAVAQVITLIGTIIATATLTMVFSRAVLGQSSAIGPVWREARPQLLKLTGLTLLVGLMGVAIIAVGILPGVLAGSWPLGVLGGLAGVLVTVWLWIRFALASPALMLEKQGVFKALGRSAKLVRGSWWRVFGITLLTQILTSIVAGIIILPFTFAAMALTGDGMNGILEGTAEFGWGFLIISAIGAVIALTITMPINAGVTVLLYIDQRIRREALDLELARAAGLQNYGGPGPSTAATGG
ncbi:DUF7544 domain-containing protein [Streptomyces sp. NPDC002073]|uniref:DUF7544 domain-containing protein n=1 Tax=Streptomyces sp. NBC_00239 TaxID=2903640 RepID=UPI002E2B90D4|nr:hypothetical protein [Streptomyces sp. NBC_00239]